LIKITKILSIKLCFLIFLLGARDIAANIIY